MANFKNFFFASFKIPQELNKDFSVFNKVPWGELAVTIYIPGKKKYCQFTITTNIGLYGYRSINSIKEVTYSPINIKANTFSRVFDRYQNNDEIFFTKMLEENQGSYLEHTKFSFLIKESIYDMSLNEFIKLVETKFLDKVNSILNENFQIHDDSNNNFQDSSDKKISIKTVVDTESINKSLDTFKTEFRKANMFCNHSKNRKFLKIFIPSALINFNEILASHSLPNLKRKLALELNTHNFKSNQVKI